MDSINVNELRFRGATDSETIQNAIDYAEKTGLGRVTIPRHNERTGENIWIIEKTILLPSQMTVVIEDAHLRLADGVFENIFRNRNCRTPLGNTMEGEQFGINILGTGNALLDGGEHNGLTEQMHRDNPEKYPKLSINLLIFFHNVRNFRIEGLRLIESRWWAICCVFCRWGHISDLDFEMHATHENQDGVDLRVGCEFITIENITGITGDDTVALTALPLDDLVPETELAVEGKQVHIHDVTIRNIRSAAHGCSLLRFLNEDCAQIYNITVDGLYDTGEAISGAPIFFGVTGTNFVKKRAHIMGEYRNVTIRNVYAKSQRGIAISEPVQDLLIENVNLDVNTEVGIRFTKNFVAKNVVIRDVTVRSSEGKLNTLFWVTPEDPEALKGLTIENVHADAPKYLFRQHRCEVRGLDCEAPTEGEFTPDNITLESAYGRYHRCAYGKVIENRPKDNRIDGTIKK